MFWEDFREELRSLLIAGFIAILVAALVVGLVYAICALAEAGRVIAAILTGVGAVALFLIGIAALFAYISNSKY